MPSLMQQSLAMSMSGVQANMPEFQRRVGALIQDYQKKAALAKQAAAAAASTATVTAPAPVAVPTEAPK
jgi:hypothetical protein